MTLASIDQSGPINVHCAESLCKPGVAGRCAAMTDALTRLTRCGSEGSLVASGTIAYDCDYSPSVRLSYASHVIGLWRGLRELPVLCGGPTAEGCPLLGDDLTAHSLGESLVNKVQ